MCIARDDFKLDIREALAELLKDELPCLLLMRTAIVASMSLNEIRRFVLSEVIPNLLKKQVWANAKCKAIWDGICHFVKKFATNKDAEQTLRCLLGLHGAQLKVVLRVAPTAKAPLGKTLKALSAAEKEDVLSGRWAGLDVSSKAGETAKLDADKQKIIKVVIFCLRLFPIQTTLLTTAAGHSLISISTIYTGMPRGSLVRGTREVGMGKMMPQVTFIYILCLILKLSLFSSYLRDF